MVTLKIETKTDSYEDAVILIHEALKLISEGSQAGIIGGKIGECAFDVDVHASQQSVHPTGGSLPTSEHWTTPEGMPTPKVNLIPPTSG